MRLAAFRTTLYSAAHFAVDFTCVFYCYQLLHFEAIADITKYLLLYNLFAFAAQMPLGVVLDRLRWNRQFAAFGAILVACGCFFERVPLVLAAAAGLGNALFHVGAGRDVLCESGGRLTPLGIFVSPGAIGLYWGAVMGKGGLIWFLPSIVLVCLAASIWTTPAAVEPKGVLTEPRGALTGAAVFFCIAALFLVVVFRSYTGMSLSFPWNAQGDYALLLVFALALGKAAGGILADKLGLRPVGVLSLFAAGVLLAVSGTPALGILAVFLFNMSMPITLGAMARLKPNALGFGFGLLTFALFIGALPPLLGESVGGDIIQRASIVSLVSAFLLLFALRKEFHGK